jgi:hypothetical protein
MLENAFAVLAFTVFAQEAIVGYTGVDVIKIAQHRRH